MYKKFVAGALFNEDLKKILLIKKIKGPEINIGKWNFIGGKIENNETIYQALSREVKEETNIIVNPKNWEFFCKLTVNNGIVFFAKTITNNIFNYKQNEKEILNIFDVESIILNNDKNFAYNLPWLVNMALDFNVNYSNVYEK